MSHPIPGSQAWLNQVREQAIDPDRPIIDPHHHLWVSRGSWGDYLLGQLWADTGAGHNVQKTVFVECSEHYRSGGPQHLRCVGEAEFVARIAKASREGGGGAEVAGFVGHTDLRQPPEVLREVLAAQTDAAQGIFRGIRHAGAHEPSPRSLIIPGDAPKGLYADADFRAGVGLLGSLGHTYDAWHFHHQNPDFAALARAVPGTTLVLDHFGTPLGVGDYADRRDEIFSRWQQDIAEIARCPNVVAKLGGLAMPDNGFGWHLRALPANSDELVEAQGRYYRHTIDCFGPERCMFESNFPVDRRSISYASFWNAMKKIAAEYSADEQHAMFYGTAQRVYRL